MMENSMQVSLGQCARRTGLAQGAAQMAEISGARSATIDLAQFTGARAPIAFAGVRVLRRGVL